MEANFEKKKKKEKRGNRKKCAPRERRARDLPGYADISVSWSADNDDGRPRRRCASRRRLGRCRPHKSDTASRTDPLADRAAARDRVPLYPFQKRGQKGRERIRWKRERRGKKMMKKNIMRQVEGGAIFFSFHDWKTFSLR